MQNTKKTDGADFSFFFLVNILTDKTIAFRKLDTIHAIVSSSELGILTHLVNLD